MSRDDLFSLPPQGAGPGSPGQTGGDALRRSQPLAARMRPRDLSEFVGQSHILGPGQLLDRKSVV